MRLTIETEIEFSRCHHSGSCPCAGVPYSVKVIGEAVADGDRWETRVVEVQGLPGWMTTGDLDPSALEDLGNQLAEAAERKEAKREQVASELERISSSLLRQLSAPPAENSDFEVGALRFALRRASEELKQLSLEVA